MSEYSLEALEQASRLVYQQMSPTPQYVWPQLCEKLGATLWVKHENHTATGAFKIRGGITFLDWLSKAHPGANGIVTATRGNHGQSQARAAGAMGLKATIVVPHGNSREKNTAMRAFGAKVIEFGQDFDEARSEAARLADAEGLFIVPPYHSRIVSGVASYALELFTAAPELDVVYVPIGCGSGICGVIRARDALKLKTEIVGVVSTEADAAKQSFEAGRILETATARTFADGMAVRSPVEEAFELYSKSASRILAVSDREVAEAMRLYYACTHNLAEGAGAASLAAALQESQTLSGKTVGVILTGGNIDSDQFASVLQGDTPLPV
ncbi:threonine dehydratase [Microbulbifer taiwanensis]|uniref:Threonine dehydratase n=1 Tax=Microbulbifer taiwanensis TaxID=986746 RepID=A0ABW1YJQ5_9GAMM|nr:threonine dehydratase [Microbulbifer taiwanensis]